MIRHTPPPNEDKTMIVVLLSCFLSNSFFRKHVSIACIVKDKLKDC
jgi:hypothetical protein